jgi:hypothetical protein
MKKINAELFCVQSFESEDTFGFVEILSSSKIGRRLLLLIRGEKSVDGQERGRGIVTIFNRSEFETPQFDAETGKMQNFRPRWALLALAFAFSG